jgi:RNA polymerase sigma-70 factor (ECF subfamily)
VVDFDEKQVLEKAIQGDADSFSILYDAYIGRIYNYVYYRTGNTHDAEDLTARVFYRALNHIHTYRHMGVPFLAWLYRIAHNLVANWHRDMNRRKEVPLEDHTTFSSPHIDQPETMLIENQEKEKLLRAIKKLTSDRQHLIVLKLVEGLSNAEIAVIVGRSEGAIKSLYHRTLLAIRQDLEQDEK